MKRILLSLGLIVFVGGLVVGATGAFFSDTETSTGNTFAAGELDLTIDNSSYGFDWNRPNATTTASGVWGPNEANSWELSDLTDQLFFSFADLKPGDYGEDTISLHVQNNAWACMAFDLTGTPDNGINNPEDEAGDVTDGEDGGELQNYLSFLFWYDDGDNVLEVEEQVIDELSGLPGEVFSGNWLAIADQGDTPLQAGATTYIGKGWCFGEMTPDPAPQQDNPEGPTVGNTGFSCNGAGDHNIAQTDGIVVDVHFYAEQSRNNVDFLCSALPPVGGGEPVGPVIVTENDLAQSLEDVISDSTSWFFYNDTNDTIMTLNQFSGTGGVNEIVGGPDGVGAAKMILHSDPADPRYNIATSQFGDTKLSDISSLKYRIYDASASAQTPYLHFNVDFFNTGVWQGRLVQVPTGIVEDTWTTVDALASTWTKTSGNWPSGDTSAGTILGSTARTWAEILADYPDAETNTSVLSWLGVRVGHPGPVGEEGYVDWIEFDGQVFDFEE